MYSNILIPVDLAHAGKLGKALDVAAQLAKQFDAQVIYCGVTVEMPSSVAHSPKEYAEKLAAFAREQADRHGHRTSAYSVVSHDPTTELEHDLLRAIEDSGADLVVMASHVPGIADHIWPSNGGRIAGHAKISVFVVRD